MSKSKFVPTTYSELKDAVRGILEEATDADADQTKFNAMVNSIIESKSSTSKIHLLQLIYGMPPVDPVQQSFTLKIEHDANWMIGSDEESESESDIVDGEWKVLEDNDDEKLN